MPEMFFVIIGMYTMVLEQISAYFLNPSPQPACRYEFLSIVARQQLGKNIPIIPRQRLGKKVNASTCIYFIYILELCQTQTM
jgi:hypothetical protein